MTHLKPDTDSWVFSASVQRFTSKILIKIRTSALKLTPLILPAVFVLLKKQLRCNSRTNKVLKSFKTLSAVCADTLTCTLGRFLKRRPGALVTWQLVGVVVVRPVVLDERRHRRDVAGVHGRHAGSPADRGGLVVQVQHPEGRRRQSQSYSNRRQIHLGVS